jgi:hypothetical protein
MTTDKRLLRDLRQATREAVPLGACVRALDAAGGDLERAKRILGDAGYLPQPKAWPPFRVPEDAPEGVWPYILAKASLFLRLGPERYRKGDYFGMPDEECGPRTLDAIRSCYEQMLEGRGYRRDAPIEGVGIGGFYHALATLHFRGAEQRARPADDRLHFIDEIDFVHLMDGRTVTLYNKVPVPRICAEEE